MTGVAIIAPIPLPVCSVYHVETCAVRRDLSLKWHVMDCKQAPKFDQILTILPCLQFALRICWLQRPRVIHIGRPMLINSRRWFTMYPSAAAYAPSNCRHLSAV